MRSSSKFASLTLAFALACGGGSNTGDSPGHGGPPGDGDGSKPDDGKPNDGHDGEGDGDDQGGLGVTTAALAVANLSYLPKCKAERVGELAYVKSEKNLYACLDGAWMLADISAALAAGPAGPPGPPGGATKRCKWCYEGQDTFGYDAQAARYSLYACAAPDADGCGTWELSKTCAANELVRFEAAETDEHGFAALYPFSYPICYDPNVAQPNDECATSADCAGPKWSCETASTGNKCVEQDSWATGTGTWDYGGDHFAWPIRTVSASATCTWARNTYWHTDGSSCSISWYAGFDAPDGGLKNLAIYLTLRPDIVAGATLKGAIVLTPDASAAAHAGSVVETLDEVTFTQVDLSPGGVVTGTWRIEGTVQGTNLVRASGELRITLPKQ